VPLYGLGEWARGWVPALLGLAPDQVALLNFGNDFLALDCPQQRQVLDNYYNIMSYQADDDDSRDCRLFNPNDVICGDAITTGRCRFRLTADQLDRISNRLNNLATAGIVSGRTVFVSKTYSPCSNVSNDLPNDCPCDQAPRHINGAPEIPPTTIAGGLALTGTDANHDVLLVRAGSYDEALTIDQPVTLRATRGAVLIGR
jgi:hypothetical protein